jgi:hypothetical protein
MTSQIFAKNWRTGANITSFGLICLRVEACLQMASELDAMNVRER